MSKNINVLDRYKRYSIINNIIEEEIKNAENKCLHPLIYIIHIFIIIIIINSELAYKSVSCKIKKHK